MSVKVGEVLTFPGVRLDKWQALKPLEEASEIHGAFQYFSNLIKSYQGNGEYMDVTTEDIDQARRELIDECCDTITAVCNLLDALKVDDLTGHMSRCVNRNRKRGRM